MKYNTLDNRLKTTIAKHLQKDLGIKNPHALPKITKVIVSTGLNKSKMDSKETHQYVRECIAQITGQNAVFTKTGKSISNFKIRAGMNTGVMVTLRGKRMVDFLDRFISIVLPRVRDFRGIRGRLDGHGNFSVGIRDHSIFPEIAPPDAKQIFGMQIQIVTNAKNDEHGKALLVRMGIPFTQSVNNPQDLNALSE
jgi:large subunit ribosomal protein L5